MNVYRDPHQIIITNRYRFVPMDWRQFLNDVINTELRGERKETIKNRRVFFFRFVHWTIFRVFTSIDSHLFSFVFHSIFKSKSIFQKVEILFFLCFFKWSSFAFLSSFLFYPFFLFYAMNRKRHGIIRTNYVRNAIIILINEHLDRYVKQQQQRPH